MGQNGGLSLLDETVAVLTGDVVRSTRMAGSARHELLEGINRTGRELRAEFGASIPYEVDIFRGDSWQLLVAETRLALRVALFFRARLRSLLPDWKMDTRIGIGVGTVDFLPEKGVSSGDGDAFRRSGWALEELGRTFRMAYGGEGPQNECLDVCVRLVDFPASNWTARQAFAVAQALLGHTQEDIAQHWMDRPITQQAVAQHLARAGWHAVDTAVQFFERQIDGF